MRTFNVQIFASDYFQFELILLTGSSLFFWAFAETYRGWMLFASVLLGISAGWFGSWAYRTERIRFWK